MNVSVARDKDEPFWRRHLVLLLVGGFACLLVVIVLIQLLDVDIAALLEEVPPEVAYLLTFLLVWFDAVIPIFPGETTLSAASTMAAQGELQLGLVMLAGALGAIVGDSSLFWIARRNAHRVQSQLDRALENPKVSVAWDALHRSTGLLLVAGRFVPGMRFAVNATMGLSDIPYRRFLLWSIVGGPSGRSIRARWHTKSRRPSPVIRWRRSSSPRSSPLPPSARSSSSIATGGGRRLQRPGRIRTRTAESRSP